ncbi:class I SAM-dependent methyltransferase [Simiduia aestuariiviva]|uniref:2-polyprenyl-3-methyl-5-hydroxy-6-metoxy-1, 4-benzoquinol methylase n=1 Tax=Simiduia aestuariiviva TaxID=1510459 RepID=A0A839UQ06_9GAMM|nr:class I SAM-dependent methyltransferase [Simiduia aestuariiviva]MBB3169932.1 2-polyprenyl-3-methyl-5-hydroxy-6-metoxy-1,4-benzoquinol methylase [Simiduia aestuariiviva]
MENKTYWENIYTTSAADSVSWFQTHADTSLHYINKLGLDKSCSIIDVGGGASTLIDDLIVNGYSNLTVLDLSKTALETAQQRLGDRTEHVQWIEADVTRVNLEKGQFDIWHDRAAFHFLTQPEDRIAYLKNLLHSVKINAHIIISTFSENGPNQCSGLPVARYSARSLQEQFGKKLLLVEHFQEMHQTPTGKTQEFLFAHFTVAS